MVATELNQAVLDQAAADARRRPWSVAGEKSAAAVGEKTPPTRHRRRPAPVRGPSLPGSTVPAAAARSAPELSAAAAATGAATVNAGGDGELQGGRLKWS